MSPARAAPAKRRRESADAKRSRARSIAARLAREYADATCALTHADPLQLLVATILSAQCTDARVNLVTPGLFARYRDARAFAESPPGELEEAIRSTGFFNNKAKSIRGACKAIVEEHGGKVPRTMDELLELPGVARKTANVVLGTAFGIASGVVVDTHVQRLSLRLALTRALTPEKIEHDLMHVIPKDNWIRFSHQIIWHGRRVCFARKPACGTCTLAPFCPSAGLET